MEMDFSDITGQLSWSSPPILTEWSPGRVSSEDIRPQHTSMIGTPPFFENFDFDMFHHIDMTFDLMKDLPWFQLQTLMEQPGWYPRCFPLLLEL
jgi:hypothetical protein